jgi:outer membrane lipoprotein-sorting protein
LEYALKKITIIPYVFICIYTSSLLAQGSAIITRLKKKYSPETSIELAFDLNIFWKVREKHEKKEGALMVAPNDKFRLKLGSTEWVSNGHTYWQYNVKTNQVIIKNLLDVDLSMHPTQILKTYLSYTFTVKSDNEKEAVLVWTVKKDDKEKSFTSITLWVDKKKNILKKLVVIDKNENESTYIFKKTKTGIQIPSETFSFEVPKGVEVLDTRD